MGFTDRFTGRDVVVEFTPLAGALIVVSGDFTNFTMDRKVDTVDATASNEVNRRFLQTLRSLDWSMSVYGGDETTFAIFKVGAEGRLDVYPKGKSAGKPKRAFNVIVTSVQETYPFDNMVEYEISGLRTGDDIWAEGSVV